MQKRKFDELISHFNRKVSDMSIDQKYKMELLGMISAIGFAHEKELGTNLASLDTDCISREQAIDALNEVTIVHSITDFDAISAILDLPSIQPKRGYWIKTGDKEETYGTVSKCSVCGVIDYEGNFCPNCGAKMEVTDG